jgi:CRP/FNR family transcriptional regulator
MSIDVLEAPIRVIPRSQKAGPAGDAALTAKCSNCHMRELCLPCGLTSTDVEWLDRLILGRRRVKAGQALYREGDRFQFIYAARMGSYKSVLMLADGREQVSAFHMAGEVMGLDGLAQGRHASGAVALEDGEVCAIPYSHLAELSAERSNLQNLVSRLMSREIVRDHSVMMLLGNMNAEERLAAFLLNLSQRMKARGYSATEFHLRMSREEIGSYLGMKIETVSRTFTAFQQQRLLEVDKRHVRIRDIQGLAAALQARAQ